MCNRRWCVCFISCSLSMAAIVFRRPKEWERKGDFATLGQPHCGNPGMAGTPTSVCFLGIFVVYILPRWPYHLEGLEIISCCRALSIFVLFFFLYLSPLNFHWWKDMDKVNCAVPEIGRPMIETEMTLIMSFQDI